MSGVATQTQRYVRRVAGTSAKIYDTRKTIPGFRLLDKYAVRCGGGFNHRVGLYDGLLVKDNHLAGVPLKELAAQLAPVVNRCRAEDCVHKNTQTAGASLKEHYLRSPPLGFDWPEGC